MKGSTIALLLATGLPLAAAESKVPTRMDDSRYLRLKKESPFAVASPEEKPVVVVNNLAQDHYLSSASKLIVAGAEVDWVALRSRRDPSVIIELFGKEPSPDGYQLERLE